MKRNDRQRRRHHQVSTLPEADETPLPSPRTHLHDTLDVERLPGELREVSSQCLGRPAGVRLARLVRLRYLATNQCYREKQENDGGGGRKFTLCLDSSVQHISRPLLSIVSLVITSPL